MVEPRLTGQGHPHGMDMDEHERHEREQEQAQGQEQDEEEEEEIDNLGTTDGEPPKKRRRTAKPNADKKFECGHEGCGKSYSRAEHLYRHQLNHTPKQIYHCDFPDCNRYFVRQDLCVRHRERHTTQGSQLHKRDTFSQASQNQNQNQHQNRKPSNVSPSDSIEKAYNTSPTNTLSMEVEVSTTQGPYVPTDPTLERSWSDSQAPEKRLESTTATVPSATIDPRFMPPTPRTNTSKSQRSHHRSTSFGESPLSPEQAQPPNLWSQRRDSLSRLPSSSKEQIVTQSVPQSPIRTYSDSSMSTRHAPYFRTNSETFLNNTHMNNTYLLGPDMLHMNYPVHMRSPDMPRPTHDAFAAAVSQGLSATHTDPFLYSNFHNGNAAIDVNVAYGYPIFGADEYSRSPFNMNDEFTAWLFNPNVAEQTNFSPDFISSTYSDNINLHAHDSVMTHSPDAPLPLPYPLPFASQDPAATSILGTQSSNWIMSENKRHELLDIMQTQFVERPHDAVKKRKDMVFEGDIDSEGHILSLRMMHTYIGSYWYHQHAQLPILHKPTFSADRAPTLLLLAVIAIGAATLDKAYGTSLTDSAAEFANFIVWHLRWEIIRDVDFRPPAKLWVFQTLLLIEVYEKMYSTRTLHERAHIHHDSTLTLMRRGSSLIGRSASETPPNLMDERNGRVVNNNHLGVLQDTPDESWVRWITTEATRRAVFGAFVLDSIHSTMFGHSAKMVAHELRLPLPCDEALWSATTPAEVGRVQASLRTNGIKPIGFLDGLKRTFSGQSVRTNSFGRSIIMAGLLSVSWHMTQRDLQIAAIGPRATNSMGGVDKWKGSLLRAFDNWKRDFDEALAEAATALPVRISGSPTHSLLRPVDDENIFETRTVLHHLAHIASHVDIVDCQVFAGANRLLSRSVTPRDYSVIREKIEKWATRASARDAAFYALKFITTVLIPPNAGSDSIDNRIYGHASPILPQAYDSDRYIARDDFLLNRPWVLYISALVVWCYGYALEGPIVPTPRDEEFATYEQREKDMRDFLDRVASVRAPDDLENVTGRNRCLGLLLILKESFASTRWELTHEAAGLLGNAAMKLKGTSGIQGMAGPGLEKPSWPRKTNGVNGNGQHDIKHGVENVPPSVSAFNTARP